MQAAEEIRLRKYFGLTVVEVQDYLLLPTGLNFYKIGTQTPAGP